ncbi:MAG: PTS sugar transporter subunit IIA [Verrucomicrobia bacterium]|nr:PTS sugar transporter subunit IIA [Verrucomicrobiota bacterium]
MHLGQFTEPKLLIPRLLSRRPDGAIRELALRLEAAARIRSASLFLEALLKRESEAPTFVAQSVAVPHLRGGAVNRLSFAVGLSSSGIPWGRNGRPVATVVFLIAVPLTEAATYLSMLSGLSSLIQDEFAFKSLRRATQPEQMQDALNGVRLPRITKETDAPV